MRAFFGLTAESLQSKSVYIDKFLPAFIKSAHSQCMRDFYIKGETSRLGHFIDAFVVKEGVPYNIELSVEILSA